MKTINIIFIALLAACSAMPQDETERPKTLRGTWKLVSGRQISGTDTTDIDYTQGQEMIKMFNETHFAFLRHDLNQGMDSSAIFVSGGGTYKTENDTYTEYLDYCNYREWEGHQFELTFEISGDTLITSGVERIEQLNIDQINIERLVRVSE
jgi:hypothetical protein